MQIKPRNNMIREFTKNRNNQAACFKMFNQIFLSRWHLHSLLLQMKIIMSNVCDGLMKLISRGANDIANNFCIYFEKIFGNKSQNR